MQKLRKLERCKKIKAKHEEIVNELSIVDDKAKDRENEASFFV